MKPGFKSLGVATSIFFLGCYWVYLNSYHIKNNMEESSVYCGFVNNAKLEDQFFLPRCKNYDLNGDGKFESYQVGVNEDGKMFYQEMKKEAEGYSLGEVRTFIE